MILTTSLYNTNRKTTKFTTAKSERCHRRCNSWAAWPATKQTIAVS